MNRTRTFGAVAGLVLLAAVACTDDETGPSTAVNFSAALTGAAERPNPVTTTATGTGSVVINEAASTMTFTLSVTGVTDITMAHIHVGDANTAGPITVDLLPVPPAAGVFTGVLASGTITAAMVVGGETFTTLVAKMRAGNTYFNVHNVTNTGGHIRGQLVAQ